MITKLYTKNSRTLRPGTKVKMKSEIECPCIICEKYKGKTVTIERFHTSDTNRFYPTSEVIVSLLISDIERIIDPLPENLFEI